MSNQDDILQSITSKIVPLEPGLELDKLIAKKVLGWFQDSDIGGPRAWWFENDETMASGAYPTMDEALHLNHFSTDIKAAWVLVERFRLTVRPFGDTFWTATKKYNEDEMVFLRNLAPTAPHAICLAALFYANEDGE